MPSRTQTRVHIDTPIGFTGFKKDPEKAHDEALASAYFNATVVPVSATRRSRVNTNSSQATIIPKSSTIAEDHPIFEAHPITPDCDTDHFQRTIHLSITKLSLDYPIFIEENPRPLQTICTAFALIWPGNINDVDREWTDNMLSILEDFSPAGQKVLYQQAACYLYRVVEYEEKEGRRYEGEYWEELANWFDEAQELDDSGYFEENEREVQEFLKEMRENPPADYDYDGYWEYEYEQHLCTEGVVDW